ncbi:MAG: hypothetical protein M0D53_16135 [Flavobacterium sp. JAD_PAG50586_2]|nr:MAG: hypothetical protein M0D53_16135 [Flavobacterium sp. JAD_PAG50586_2]
MIDLIKWLHDLIKDKGTKWFTKLFFVFIILMVIYSVDDYYGWSYYSKINNQVHLIKEINECIKDSTLTKEEVSFLNEKRIEVINRENIVSNSWEFSKGFFTQKTNGRNLWENIKFEFLYGKEIVPLYRYFLLNFGLIILSITLFIKLIKSRTIMKQWSYVVLWAPFFMIITSFNSWFYGLIPVFSKSNIWINYILLLFMGFVIFFGTLKEIKKKNK